jgi:16S rRNA (guanine(966)-N(2))-methyltransferase RsmD
MRIIAGAAGGRRIVTPRGAATRPTADRVRESIFNLLAARFELPRRVLDLYAGTGALGLEAVSRGAGAAVLVEESAKAARLIADNAAALGFGARSTVVTDRVVHWLSHGGAGATTFGWVFLDPPYASHATGELDKALALLGPLVERGGVVVAEHDWRHAPREEPGALALLDRRRYGQTAVSFYQ